MQVYMEQERQENVSVTYANAFTQLRGEQLDAWRITSRVVYKET